MKIQCPCGTKYSFDITPEMARAPITFVCQKCGVDSSEMVNQLIRQQLDLAAPLPASPGSVSVPAFPPPPTTEPVIVRVNTPATAPAPGATGAGQLLPASRAAPLRVPIEKTPAASEASPAVAAPQFCLKHMGQLTTHRCVICQKPICPQCMELFGFVCSAHCKGKAETQGANLPVYEHQKSAVEARQWRKVGLIAGAITTAVVAGLGLWIYYAWFASVPKAVFSVRFQQAAYSGQCRLVPTNQVVYLHGGTLARHDLNAKKEIWSLSLIDKKKIAEEAAAMVEQLEAARDKARANSGEGWMTPTLPETIESMQSGAAAALQLHARGENVWVSFSDKLVRYDWQTGKPAQEIPLGEFSPQILANGDELLLISEKETGQQVTHVNFASGEARTEEIAAPVSAAMTAAIPSKVGGAVANRTPANRLAPAKGSSNQVARLKANQLATLLAASKSAQADTKPLDPAAVANKAQNMALPARLALPAVLAANANQQRLQAEMRDQAPVDPRTLAVPPGGSEHTSLLPDGNRFVQFSVKLLESKIIARQAMKAPPKKSALEGDVNASSTAAVANEILNEIQRDRGADVVQEDVSRYQVTLRRPGVKEAAEWTGEVTGPPELFPLQTVDVLAAGKSIWVFDKANKKLWESKLNYAVSGGFRAQLSGEIPPFGEGPIVERGDTLYLFDSGVLSAFELATGNARWRLPSVGISGLHFDERGMIYVNTSSQSPDILKYPNQIDISEKVRQEVLKIDSRTGATLWKAEQEGLVSYVSGKFIYTTASYHGDEGEGGGGLLGVKTGLEIPSHIRIKRLAASNGRVLWEHYQPRAPLDMRFEQNTIQLLFKKEMQVLKFFSL